MGPRARLKRLTGRSAWLVLCFMHGALSMVLWWAALGPDSPSTWRADHWPDAIWTLWTTAWVHLGASQLIVNQLALGALTGLVWWTRPAGLSAAAWLLAWPLAHLSLLAWPQIGYAVGLGPVVHAGIAAIACELLLRADSSGLSRRWGLALLLGLGVKLAYEQGWQYPVSWDSANDSSVVFAGRFTGALWGLGLTLVLLLPSSLRRRLA